MSFKNELEELEEYISDLVKKIGARGPLRETPGGQTQSGYPATLVEQAKKNIGKVAFGLMEPGHRCEYIRRHQQVLIQLWNEVLVLRQAQDDKEKVSTNAKDTQRTQSRKTASGGHSSKATGSSSRDPILTVYECLEELHEFLRTQYADCFDMHADVARGYLLMVKKEFDKKRSLLIDLVVRKTLPKGLAEVVVFPYEMILAGKAAKWSYHKIKWLHDFLEVLEDVGGDTNIKRDAMDTQRMRRRVGFYTVMIQKLIYYNFNSSDFKTWLLDAIHEDVAKQNCFSKKLERLSYHDKELCKLSVVHGEGYLHKLPGVRDEVCKSIEKEIMFLKEKYGSAEESPDFANAKSAPFDKGGMASAASIPASGGQLPETGIYFGTSVEELGIYLAAMMETGLVKNVNRTQLAEFLAKHCHSIGRDQFSGDHLYNSFGSKDARVIDRLVSKLMDVVNRLRKWR